MSCLVQTYLSKAGVSDQFARPQVCMHACGDLVASVPFFEDAEEGFTTSVVTLLRPTVCAFPAAALYCSARGWCAAARLLVSMAMPGGGTGAGMLACAPQLLIESSAWRMHLRPVGLRHCWSCNEYRQI
jgi:hypothetical protein